MKGIVIFRIPDIQPGCESDSCISGHRKARSATDDLEDSTIAPMRRASDLWAARLRGAYTYSDKLTSHVAFDNFGLNLKSYMG